MATRQQAFEACSLAMPGEQYHAAWAVWSAAEDVVRDAFAALGPGDSADAGAVAGEAGR